MEGRDKRSTPKFTGQGLEAKEFKVEAEDSFPTYMRSHRIDSHPALLYNSSSIFGVGPRIVTTRHQSKFYKQSTQEEIYD